MATYTNGQSSPLAEWYDSVPAALEWDTVEVWRSHGDPYEGSFAAEGIWSNGQPGFVNGAVYAGGEYAQSMSQDYYYRIHINPNPLNVGNLLSLQTKDVEVWNAFVYDTKLLNSITAAGITDGVALIEPEVTPTTFNYLESRTYQVQLETQGPALIDVSYTFDFPDEDPVLVVSGQRVVVFSFPIDWGRPLLERLEWRTDVMKTQAGAEFRHAIRTRPRRFLEFRAWAHELEATVLMDALLFSWQARRFAIPVWMDASRLQTGLNAGDTSIPVDTADKEYIAGDNLILWRSATEYETAQIQSVQANDVTLVRGLASSWPIDTTVAPIRYGTLTQNVNVDRHTSRYGNIIARFELDQQDSVDTSGYAGAAHNGFDVLPFPPNFVRPVKFNYARDSRRIDYETGIWAIDDPSDLANVITDARYLLNGRLNIKEFKQWLYRRKGKAIPALVRTYMNELELRSIISATGNACNIAGIGYDLYYQMKGGRNYFALRTKAGQWFYREINAYSPPDVNGEHTIGYDDPTGLEINPDDVAVFMFLTLSRLNSDGVEISWVTNEVAEVTVPMRSIKQ